MMKVDKKVQFIKSKSIITFWPENPDDHFSDFNHKSVEKRLKFSGFGNGDCGRFSRLFLKM